MTNKNYYEKFGLKENATNAEIKKAYRKLALKYHPDKNGGDLKFDNIFKEINQIYQTLSETTMRQIYDNELQRQRSTTNTSTYYTHHTNPTHEQTKKYDYSRQSTTSQATYSKAKDYDFEVPNGFRKFFNSIMGWGIVILILALINTFQKKNSNAPIRNTNTTLNDDKDYYKDTVPMQTGEIHFGTNKNKSKK
jgi:curved DNA-binding protein CbpA